MRYKRKNKIPSPWLQFKLTQCFLAATIICIVAQYAIAQSALTELLVSSPDVNELPDRISAITRHSLYVSMAIAVPLVLLLGAVVTFRVIGPLVGLERYLRRLLVGGEVRPWRVREGDELGGLAGLVNEVLEHQRQQLGAAQDRPAAGGEAREEVVGRVGE